MLYAPMSPGAAACLRAFAGFFVAGLSVDIVVVGAAAAVSVVVGVRRVLLGGIMPMCAGVDGIGAVCMSAVVGSVVAVVARMCAPVCMSPNIAAA
jgi:hypothetical protein